MPSKIPQELNSANKDRYIKNQTMTEKLAKGIGTSKPFFRAWNSYNDYLYFLKRADRFSNKLKTACLKIENSPTKEFLDIMAHAEKNLKAQYLFAEVFLCSFVSDLCQREMTFQFFLANADKFAAALTLPKIEECQRAYCASVYRGKIIGHQKNQTISSGGISPFSDFRLQFYRVIENSKSIEEELLFPSELQMPINNLWKKFNGNMNPTSYWAALEELFREIPFGNYGAKSAYRNEIDDIMGKAGGGGSMSYLELDDAISGFLSAFIECNS